MSTTASTTTKHTPTPWAYDSATNQIRNEQREVIADLDYSGQLAVTDQANAAFIVKAVNSHGQLLAALRDANELLKQEGMDLDDAVNCDIVARIHSALAAGGAA